MKEIDLVFGRMCCSTYFSHNFKIVATWLDVDFLKSYFSKIDFIESNKL